jgi:copper chaperone CopZ
VKAAFLSAALLVCGTSALAASKVTVGVGHMCCDGCKAAAKSALNDVSSDVAIDGKNVTITLKEGETNVVPVLLALEKGGFPATSLNIGGDPVTIGVAHLCCGGCKASLTKALEGSKIEELDTASVKIGDDSVTVKAKDGKSLDLMTVLAAMEKGGFSPKSITVGASAASKSSAPKKVARR